MTGVTEVLRREENFQVWVPQREEILLMLHREFSQKEMG
jgi:hypothetical protein